MTEETVPEASPKRYDSAFVAPMPRDLPLSSERAGYWAKSDSDLIERLARQSIN